MAGAISIAAQKIVQQLDGGLTNTNYLIEAGSQRAVLRINNPQADKLGC